MYRGITNIINLAIKTRGFLNKIKAKIKYFGLKYYCPLCGSFIKEFKPAGEKNEVFERLKIVGGGYRENCVCPICGSYDRERLLYLYLKKQTNIFNHNTDPILHIAPEKNLGLKLQKSNKDAYMPGDKNYRKGINLIDVESMSFADNYFGYIICCHVLEHVRDDNKALREMYRVLKKNGLAVIQVPISMELAETKEGMADMNDSMRLREYGQIDHVRVYARDYINRLEKSGFKVEVVDLVTNKKRYGLLDEEKLYVCMKH